MKKQLAVALTAGIALTAAGAPAFAQDDKITVEGLLFLDRNGDNAFNEGETVRANGNGVKIYIQGKNELVGTFPTGPDGKFKAVLPKGPTYDVNNNDMFDFTSTKLGYSTAESKSDANFPLSGTFLNGFTFVDANGDGVKQENEKTHGGKVKVTGKTQTGADVKAEAEAGADGAYLLDLPIGDLTITAPEMTKSGLALAKPKTDYDIDWLTGTRVVTPNVNTRTQRVDLRYFEPKGDLALEDTTVSPAKDVYTVGDQIDVKFKLLNKGDVPAKASVVMFGFASGDAKVLSRSDNVTGTHDDFETVAKILPGESITVEMKLELTSTELEEIYPFVRPNVGGLKDVDHKNQGQPFRKVIKVVAKGTSTEPSTPPSGTTTVAPTTTTTQAVAKAGNNSGLASTGASPLGFLGLGALLLAVGTGAFFVARRRRS